MAEKKKTVHIVDTCSSNTSIVLLGPSQGAGSEENIQTMRGGKSHDIEDGTKTVLGGNIDLNRDPQNQCQSNLKRFLCLCR